MKKHLSQRYFHYLVLASLSLLAGIILGRLEPVVLSLPFLSAITLSLLVDLPPRIEVSHHVSRHQTFEGDEIEVVITAKAGTELPAVEILDPLPERSLLSRGTNDIVTSLKAGEQKRFSYAVVISHRERFQLGALVTRIHSASGLIYWEQIINQGKECIAYPNLIPLKHAIVPRHTQVNVGNYTSRAVGDGIEFSDIREYCPGDPVRRINWRVSVRTGELHVNEYARERNADVVLMVDTFSMAGNAEYNTLDIASRGAAALAYHFLSSKNRVGFIEYGGTFRWALPSLGMRQWYKILEYLTDMEVKARYASKDLATIPRRILPSQSLVLAITPLVDQRFIEALVDLHNRGFDAVAIALSPAKVVQRAVADNPVHRTSLRIWELEHQSRILTLQRGGLAVLEWDPQEPLELLARAIDALRRRRGAMR
jgi:uncharacterized protein (DUF58 family)